MNPRTLSAAIALWIGTSVGPGTQSVLAPGSAALSTSKLSPASRVDRYAGSTARDSTARELYHEDNRLDVVGGDKRRQIFRLIKVISNARFAFADTLLFRRDGLVPIAEQMHSGALVRTIRYHGDSVEIETQRGDSAPRTSGHRFGSPIFGFNQLEQIVQSLPFRAGYTAVVPLYSEGSDQLEMDTVTVTGKSEAGTWMVRFADPVIVATYDINRKTRAVESYEVVPRAGGRIFRMK